MPDKEYQVPEQSGPEKRSEKSYTINTKYVGREILNAGKDYDSAIATGQNVVNAVQYGVDPNLVLNQIASERKYIVQSAVTSSLKTGVITSFIAPDAGKILTGENLRKYQQEETSRFGTPIYDVIQFGGDTTDGVLRYTISQYDSKSNFNKVSGLSSQQGGTIETLDRKFTDHQVEAKPTKLLTCIARVDQTKNIVTTNIQGRNGPVFEYIGMGAYQINIKGVIVSPYADVYPTDEVSNLLDMLEAPVSIRITSNVLNIIFNIFKVVVMDYNFYSDEGMRNVVHFEINCLDENPFEIKRQTV